MTDRSTRWLLTWAAVLTGFFLLLGILVSAGWQALLDVDADLSDPVAGLVDGHAHVLTGLHWFEVLTGTIAAEVTAIAVALLLWSKGHPRAGAYFALVNSLTLVSVQLLKAVFDRDRPEWQVVTNVLHNGSYPSGHAAWAASIAGSLAVLVSMLVRKAPVRRVLYAALALSVVLIAADRLLLGRHFLTDVIGGAALGGIWVLLVLAFYSPVPRSHARRLEPLLATTPSGTRDLHVVLNPIKVEDLDAFRNVVAQTDACPRGGSGVRV